MLAYRLCVVGLVVVSLCTFSSYCSSESAGTNTKTPEDDVVPETSEKGSSEGGGGKSQPEKMVVAYVPDYPSK